MLQRTVQKVPAAAPIKIISARSGDVEFLPAALELLETPTSPVTISLIWTICLVFSALLIWSYFGRLDIYAIAVGKVQPQGLSKVVQPLDPGRVSAIFVKNGSRVHQGDVLVELDSTETAADIEANEGDLASAAAEVERRRAAIEIASSGSRIATPIEFTGTVSEAVRLREQAALAADISKLAASEDTFKAQLAEKLASKQRLIGSIETRTALIGLDKELVDMRQNLLGKGVGSRASVIEASQRYEADRLAQVSDQGQLREAEEEEEGIRRKLEETVAQFISEQSQKVVEAAQKRDHVAQDLVKARSKNARTQLKAPIDGVVQQLATTTLGQVVSAGQTLMTIVPTHSPLEVNAIVLNKDIGFVHEGQKAVVKVEAFPFTRYGTLEGTVTRLSTDAVDMRNAPNLSEAAAVVKPGSPALNSPSSEPQLGYPAIITLTKTSMNIDGRQVDLSPGMSVTVEITTGSRRGIDYILSPLREMAAQSAHER